jgi:hypothetical protein
MSPTSSLTSWRTASPLEQVMPAVSRVLKPLTLTLTE